MNKLPAEVKTYIQQQTPKGITLFRDKNLYVKVSKTVNGKDTPLTKSLPLLFDNSMTVGKMKEVFHDRLAEALNVQRQLRQRINNPNFTSFREKRTVGTATIGGVFNTYFEKEWGLNGEKQKEHVRSFYKDLKEYFGENKRLADITEEDIDDFKEFCARKIAERPKNMTGTVSNNSINKRLGVLRSLYRIALSKSLIANDQLINPDPRVKNMGIVDLPRGETKRKPAFTEFEQEQFLQVIKNNGDDFWHDVWAWAFDTGMRHDGELDSFTCDNINLTRKTIQFARPKTKTWSIEMPLTPRCMEIVKRRMPDAMKRDDRKMFPVKATQRRSNWWKYIKMCNFNEHFSPYTTRHTFITRLAENEVNQKTTMELAGHKCIQTTLTYYTKSTTKLLEKAISSLSNNRDMSENNNNMIGHNSRKALIK